ncbi:MAG: hypothetical protein AAF371_12625 [Pseudomonadota bacterium]
MPDLLTKRVHAYLDYPVALGLIALPFLLGLGAANPLALWLSVATGVVALILTVLTDHHLGLVRVLPFRLHLAVDLAVGLVFVATPFLFGFAGLAAAYYWVLGTTIVAVVLLNAPERGRISA